MAEADTIHADYLPLTVDSMAEQFAACGLAAGQTVIVHSSLSKMGWVAGGAKAVIEALLRVLTPTGTLVMPAHTSDNSDPAAWQNPPVPEHWWPIIRQHMPAYDPATSPTRMMGAIAELFRTWPGARRSGHPQGSFAALGPHADAITHDHALEGFGPQSPLARVYELDGYVLLIGVGHSNNTSLHLAEYHAQWPGKRTHQQAAAMLVNGERQWVEYEALDIDSDDFDTLGEAYEAAHGITRCHVGQAEVRFMRQRPLVDFAIKWMAQNRDFTQEVKPT